MDVPKDHSPPTPQSSNMEGQSIVSNPYEVSQRESSDLPVRHRAATFSSPADLSWLAAAAAASQSGKSLGTRFFPSRHRARPIRKEEAASFQARPRRSELQVSQMRQDIPELSGALHPREDQAHERAAAHQERSRPSQEGREAGGETSRRATQHNLVIPRPEEPTRAQLRASTPSLQRTSR